MADADVSTRTDELLDTYIRYTCVGRDARVSGCRISQAIYDKLYLEGLEQDRINYVGSFYEGMPWKVCNDLDIMFTHKSCPLVSFTPETGGGTGEFLVAETIPGNPAYTRLTTVPGVKYESEFIQQSSQTKRSLSNISSAKFMELLFETNEEYSHVQGPAVVDLSSLNQPGGKAYDIVYCLYSPVWPPCASDFLTRPRKSGWPQQNLIDKLQQQGCHVVPVGHPYSENKDVEWRWSFSVAEKELIHDINTDMFCTMYLMKALKNKYWTKDEKPTIFCSYFIKTACLWVGEQTEQTNIMDLCREVIDWLLTCYRTHRLPHYFIHGQNLIGHLQQDKCEEVVHWLSDIRESLSDKIIVVGTDLMGSTEESQDLNHLISSAKESYDRRNDGELYAMLHLNQAAPLREYIHVIENCELNMLDKADDIVLHIINDVENLVKHPLISCFRAKLHQDIGSIFQILHVFYTTKSNTSPHSFDIHATLAVNKCYQNVVHHYTEGLEMVYPDGWSDRGLGGYVRLATFYHLNGERDKLEETLKRLEPMLEWGSENLLQGYDLLLLPPIWISFIGKKMEILPWKQDTLLCIHLLETWDKEEILFHPVCFGYYLLARHIINTETIPSADSYVGENTSDREATFKCSPSAGRKLQQIITRMEKCCGVSPLEEQVASTRLLIQIISHDVYGVDSKPQKHN